MAEPILTVVVSNDYDKMIAAADAWSTDPDTGKVDLQDPSRRWFLVGWINERDGKFADLPDGDVESNIADWCAYNSGRIAQREQQ